LQYRIVLDRGFDLALSALMTGARSDERALSDVWDELVRSRAMVLEEMARRHETVATSRSPASELLAKELAAARNRLVRLTLTDTPAPDPAAYRTDVRRARQEQERLERALEATAPGGEEQASVRIALRDVAHSLPEGTAL